MDLPELTAEVLRLKQQVEQLQADLLDLRQALRPGPPAFSHAASQLVRRNAERLADEVRRRGEFSPEPEADTEIDLLIDRLHELALENEGP